MTEELEKLMKNPFQRKKFDIREYWERNRLVGKYGVPYLDRELLGIAKTDLVVIGARSGAGKSSLARIIFNANDKKTTVLFSLENYDGDTEASSLRKEYNSLSGATYPARQWQTNDHMYINKELLAKAAANVEKQLEDSIIFGRTVPDGEDDKGWLIDDLEKKIIWCATHGKELIIIDHLDYLDRDNPNESDNEHITRLMRAIRSAQELGSAVVAFSHLRKPIGKVDEVVVPNENEFIGSSNKIKQATQVIMFAPGNEGDDKQGYVTWCCIRKNRNGGIKNQVAKMYFMPSTETYRPNYDVHTVNYSGTKVSESPILKCDEKGLITPIVSAESSEMFQKKGK